METIRSKDEKETGKGLLILRGDRTGVRGTEKVEESGELTQGGDSEENGYRTSYVSDSHKVSHLQDVLTPTTVLTIVCRTQWRWH